MFQVRFVGDRIPILMREFSTSLFLLTINHVECAERCAHLQVNTPQLVISFLWLLIRVKIRPTTFFTSLYFLTLSRISEMIHIDFLPISHPGAKIYTQFPSRVVEGNSAVLVDKCVYT